MSLLSENDKNEINAAMNQIFETFKRSELCRFYKPNEEEIIVFQENFNADLEEYHNPNVTRETQYQDFECRIIFPKRENTFSTFIEGGANIAVKGEQDLGLVYIQFQEEEALEYLKDSIRFTMYGDKYTKHTSPRRIGVLDTFNVFQITLKRVN